MHMVQIARRWTVDGIHSFPDDDNRYEVIDGELFVTPAPRWSHQDAVRELSRIIHEYVQRERIGHVFHAPADVDFSNTRLVQPDLFVVPLVNGRRPGRFRDVGRLLLAVEVLSPGTARADRVTKRTLFRAEGVPDYWIVDLDARCVERSTPSDERIDMFVDELAWHPAGASTPLAIHLPTLFASVLDQ